MSFPQNVILWYCTSRTSPYPVKTQRDFSDGGDLGSCQVSWSPNRLARHFGASCLHRHIQCEIETDFMGQSTHKYSWQLHNDADLIHLIHLQREASNTKLHFHCIHYIITYNHYNIHTHPLEIHIQQGRTALSAENGAFAAASLMRGFVRAISKDLSATNVSTQRRIWSAAAQHFNCFEITTERFEQTTTRTVKQIRVDYKK